MNKPKAASSLLFIILLLALTYAYAWALNYLPHFDHPDWVGIALLNSGLALLSLWLWQPQGLSPRPAPERYAAWAVGPLLLATTLLICFFSDQVESTKPSAYPYTMFEIIGLCLWVPIVEEIIFRRFLSNWIGQKLDGAWAIYISGLVFALAHTNPPLNPWPPLGPFLLGCAAALCYRASGRILAPILLHAACNGSAILFALYAPSWLELLSWLYQKL